MRMYDLQHYATLDICCWRPLPAHKKPVVRTSRRTVKRCGYDGQQKHTICDACRPCHLIRSTVRPVFYQIRQIFRAYKSLRCLDVEIWRFFVDNNNRTDYFTPMHARGVIKVIMCWFLHMEGPISHTPYYPMKEVSGEFIVYCTMCLNSLLQLFGSYELSNNSYQTAAANCLGALCN